MSDRPEGCRSTPMCVVARMWGFVGFSFLFPVKSPRGLGSSVEHRFSREGSGSSHLHLSFFGLGRARVDGARVSTGEASDPRVGVQWRVDSALWVPTSMSLQFHRRTLPHRHKCRAQILGTSEKRTKRGNIIQIVYVSPHVCTLPIRNRNYLSCVGRLTVG